MQREDNKVLEEIGELLAIHYEDWQIQEHSGPEVAFGRYLRSVRRSQQLTIAEVAHQAKLPESEILAYERGLIPQRLIKVVSLKALAETLDEDIDTFLLLLEANLSSESSPKPSATNGDQAGGNYGHRLFPGFRYDDHLNTAGVVATLEGASMLTGYPKTMHTAQSTTLLTMHTATAPPKRTLRQVVADPLWQIKIYRVWAPVATFLLVVCLQVSIYYFNWQARYYSVASVAVESIQPHSAQAFSPPLVTAQTSSRVKLPETVSMITATKKLSLLPTGLGPSQPPTMQVEWLPIQLYHFNTESTLKFQPASISLPKQATTVLASSQSADTPLPIVHMIGSGEGMACIANQYYQNETFYPLLCLYNFGNTECKQPLRIGNLITIPVFEDFKQDDPQMRQNLAQVPSDLLNSFKTISREAVNRNQVERLRGIDYFCQDSDYQNYGKQLVEERKVDPARIKLKATVQDQYASKSDESVSQIEGWQETTSG